MSFPSAPTFPAHFKRPVSSTFPAVPTFPTSSYDPTAAAFFAAQTDAGFTPTTLQKNAFNALVVAGKSNGWWSSMLYFNPFFGNGAAADAIDAVSLSVGTFAGTVTHNSRGVQGDGLTGYFDTGFIPSNSLISGSNHCSLYINNGFVNSGQYLAGCSSSSIWFLYHPYNDAAIHLDQFNGFGVVSGVGAGPYGLITGSRISHIRLDAYLGSLSVGNFTGDNTSDPLPTSSYKIMSPSGTNNFNRAVFSSLSIGSGLTQTQMTAYNTDITAFHSAIGRAVDRSSLNPVLYIGDSITAGAGADSVLTCAVEMDCAALTSGGYPAQSLNAGVAGSTSSDWLTGGANFNAAVEMATNSSNFGGVKTAKIMLGTNDANNTVATTQANYQTHLSNTITGAFAQISTLERVFLDFPPYVVPGSSGGQFDASSLVLLQNYQTAIRNLVNGTTILLGDTTAYDFFEANQGLLIDGIHPNQTGHNDLGAAWALAALTGQTQITLVDFNGQTGASYVTGINGLYFNACGDPSSNLRAVWFNTGTESDPISSPAPIEVVITPLSTASDIAAAVVSAVQGSSLAGFWTMAQVDGAGAGTAVTFTTTANQAFAQPSADVNSGAAVSTTQLGQSPL